MHKNAQSCSVVRTARRKHNDNFAINLGGTCLRDLLISAIVTSKNATPLLRVIANKNRFAQQFRARSEEHNKHNASDSLFVNSSLPLAHRMEIPQLWMMVAWSRSDPTLKASKLIQKNSSDYSQGKTLQYSQENVKRHRSHALWQDYPHEPALGINMVMDNFR